ncbi:MAG TPA: fibronectin type III domain-containing protein, partial [Niastella sp.]
PRKTENIVYKDPQNIIFQWTPRNYNSPTSAFNTEYEFTLVEIWDNGLAPEAAFGTAQPLYRTTTQATTLLYGPGEPLLLSGHKYAWRVRAQQTDGSPGSDAWRNNGYSEIYWFNCQSDCAPPLNVQHELSSGRATITWAANPNQTSFTVDYREKGQNGSTWYNSATTANRMMLYDLKKGKSYEYRVGGTCDNGITYTYSDIKTLEIAAADSAVNTDCGLLVAEENIKNRTPIQTLLTGDVITAGDFPVKLLQVSGQSAFTGAGYVTVPFLGQSRVKVKFSGITVNTDKQLIGGVIETTYDAKESQIKNLDEVIDGGGGVGIVVKGIDTAGYYVDMVIPDARNIDVELNKTVDSAGNSVPGGGATLTITGSDGTTKQVKVEELPATIKDKSGTVYGVDKDGNVSKVASSEPVNMTAAQLNSLQIEKAVVKFLPHENQLYAFDEYQPVYSRSNLFYEEYEKLNGDYYVNSKAIVEAQTDVVKAVVEIKDNSIVADSIRFVTGKGTRYESKKLSKSTWEIKIVGGPAGDAQELYALYPQGDGKFLPLGKLFIAAYPARTFKVVLVPVSGAVVNKDAISKQLDTIYKRVGITFQVTQDKSFDDKSWDLVNDGKLAVSGSGWLSTLTDEMKALNSAYSSARTVQQDAVYLFVLSGSDSTIAGDMPRGKQFGYLFNGTDGRVAAHEIGHGLFSLKHVFDNNYGFKQGELPSNVMDYPAGDRFAKHQWDLMYKPGLVIGLFEKDADGQSHYVDIEKLLTWIRDNKGKKANFVRKEYFKGAADWDFPVYFKHNDKRHSIYAEVYDNGEVDFELNTTKEYS